MSKIECFPHCDERILHGPDDGCEFCNLQPEWQELRKAWGIAFTGHDPAVEGDRCGKLLGTDVITGKPAVCMQAKDHPASEPHLPSEPWEALPCPADYAVRRRERGDHSLWAGNRAASV